MNVDVYSLPSMIEYLKGVNITKLQFAARQSGCKFKNGPDSAKGAIIEKLSFTPSVMRTTIAVLQRMEREQGLVQGPNPFADDLRDELDVVPPSPMMATIPAPSPANGEALDKALQAIASLTLRLSIVEKTKTDSHAVRAIVATETADIREQLKGLIAAVADIKAEIKAQKPIQLVVNNVALPIIQGQHAMFKRMAFWLGLKNHALLIGPASSGKTTAAIEYARIMGLELYAQPLTMDVFGVLGFVGPQGRVETEFSRAWINGGVFLWDELSMSAKEAIGALNAALANGFATFPGLGIIKKHENFRMIAGDNSDTGANLKYGARELLDGASLDRFIRLDWPIDENIENALGAATPSWLAAVRAIRAEIDRRDIQHVGATMRAVVQGSTALQTDAVRDGHITRLAILEDTCKKGALAAEWSAVLNLPAVRAFLQGA